jgi:hydroxymethylbilane synthase
VLAAIHHEPTALCVRAERELLHSLGGGCHLPLGARAVIEDGKLRLLAGLFEADGIRWLSR